MSRSLATLGVSLALVFGLVSSGTADEGLLPPEQPVESQVLEPGAEPLLDLSYRWLEGQAETATLELWMVRSDHFGSMATEQYPPVPFRLDLHAEVQRVDPDGNALIEYRVEGVTLLEPSTDESTMAMLADLQTLLDVTVREEYDVKGHILAEELVDPLDDQDGLHPARSAVIGTIQGMPLRLPLEPIGVGGTWQEVQDSSGPAAGTETLTKRLEAIGEDGSYRITSSTIAEVPEQEIPGDDMGLDEPVVTRGVGSARQQGRVDLERLFPAWAGTYETRAELDIPTGNGVTYTVESAAGASITLSGQAGPEWLRLPVVDDTLVTTEPETTEPVGLIDRPETIAVTLLDPGAEPREILRYDLAEGQVEHTAMTMRMGLRTMVDGAWTEWLGLPPTQIAATTTVLDVLDDGSYLVDVVYTDVSVPVDPGQLPPEVLEEMEAQLASLIGLRQTIHMDDRGRVLEATTVLPPDASTEDLQPAQLDAMTQEMIDPLPEEPIGVGAVWEVARVTSDSMGFAAYGWNTITLVDRLAAGRVQLEAELYLTADPGPMVIPGMELADATLDRFSTEGAADRVVDLGLVNPPAAGSEGLSDYAFSVISGEAPETTEMQISMEFEVSLISSEEG